VRFAILGPVEIRSADGVQRVERPLRTAVLAFLLLRAGYLVTVDQLEEALWGGAPPATARPQIHAAVSRIRRVLREAGCPDALATRPGGYELAVADGATGNPSAALERYHEALHLAHQTGDRPEQARSLEGIAHALHDTGESAQAGRRWRDALSIYTDLRLPQADRLREHLATLPAG